jgi:hypothetical protein
MTHIMVILGAKEEEKKAEKPAKKSKAKVAAE